MIALKIESYELADISDLSDINITERYDTVRVQREELALNITDQQAQMPPLDLYHRSESRSTCDYCKIEQPIRSATSMDEEESKYIDSAVT
eukprot:15176460-Ditylum_brightwellii.AAC.1